MSWLKTSVLIVAVMMASCKRSQPKPAVLNRPPEVPGPTSQELQSEKDETVRRGLEPFTPLESNGIVTKGEDGEVWVKYSNGMLVQEMHHVEGSSHPQYGQMVKVAYVGKFPGTGKVFDQRGADKPLSFILGTKELIKGFNIVVAAMSTGSKWRVLIPSDLAYGAAGNPQANIMGNQPLIFEIELLSFGGEAMDMPKVETLEDKMKVGPMLPEEKKEEDAATSTAPAR